MTKHNQIAESDLFAIPVVADLTGRQPHLLYHWIATGRLPAVREGGRLYIRFEDLKYLNTNFPSRKRRKISLFTHNGQEGRT
jgi:hypothetical protein